MLVMDMRRMEAYYTCCHIIGIVLACEVGLVKKKEGSGGDGDHKAEL
jgi:hypothetical protein